MGQKNFKCALKHSIHLSKKGDLVSLEVPLGTQDLRGAGKYNVGPMGVSDSSEVTCDGQV